MNERLIEIEANTVEEAKRKLRNIDELIVLEQFVVCREKVEIIEAVADTVEAAFMKAQGKVLAGAKTETRETKAAAKQITLLVQANNEKSAGKGKAEMITSVSLLKKARKGLFGFGLRLWCAVGNKSGETFVFNNISTVNGRQLYDEGNTLFDAGTPESMRTALAKFEQARLVYQKLDARQEEAESLFMLGWVNNSLGDKQKARDYYEQALPLFRAVGDIRFEALTISRIDLSYSDSDIENFSDLSEKNH